MVPARAATLVHYAVRWATQGQLARRHPSPMSSTRRAMRHRRPHVYRIPAGPGGSFIAREQAVPSSWRMCAMSRRRNRFQSTADHVGTSSCASRALPQRPLAIRTRFMGFRSCPAVALQSTHARKKTAPARAPPALRSGAGIVSMPARRTRPSRGASNTWARDPRLTPRAGSPAAFCASCATRFSVQRTSTPNRSSAIGASAPLARRPARRPNENGRGRGGAPRARHIVRAGVNPRACRRSGAARRTAAENDIAFASAPRQAQAQDVSTTPPCSRRRSASNPRRVTTLPRPRGFGAPESSPSHEPASARARPCRREHPRLRHARPN